MELFDIFKKISVESSSSLFNNSLFKSSTDLLFDKLYRIIKNHADPSEKNEISFMIQQDEIATFYTINSLDLIDICEFNAETQDVTIHYIIREKNNYLLQFEKYKYSSLEDRELISKDQTLNIKCIEDALLNSINSLKAFFKEKEKCDDIFFKIYNYILEQGKNTKNINIIETTQGDLSIMFKASKDVKNIIEICLLSSEDLTVVTLVHKLNYYQSFCHKFESDSFDEVNLIGELEECNIKSTLDFLVFFEEVIEKTYKSVKINERTCKTNFSKFNKAKEIKIPDGVEYIEDRAFCNCKNLTKIEIPNSVTSIGDSAFEYCENLEKVILPNSLKTIQSYTFKDCFSLKEIIIPNSVTSIGDSAFEYCYDLEKIVIPNSVSFIAGNTFIHSNNTCIYCNAGSYAEQYAKENNINFKYLSN